MNVPVVASGRMRGIFALMLVLAVGVMVFSNHDDAEVAAAASPAVQAAASARAPSPVVRASAWSYQEDTDDMSGKRYKVATLVSDNSLNLDFPYRGENHGALVVRQHPRWGLDVMVQVEKGQILCRGARYRDCTLGIRFDDGAAEKLSAVRSGDSSSTVVFAAYPQWLKQKLLKAKQVTVEVPMFQAGEQTLKFTTATPLQM